jgi:hypothetical protein
MKIATLIYLLSVGILFASAGAFAGQKDGHGFAAIDATPIALPTLVAMYYP